MDKIHVVLVLLDSKNLEVALKSLNINNAKVVAIVMETQEEVEKMVTYEEIEISVVPLFSITTLLAEAQSYVWLISGFVNDKGDIEKAKNFLMASGVPEDNIVNFEIASNITPTWIANLRYIEKNPVDFFATGAGYFETGLNLRSISEIGGYKGVNLANAHQDLVQSYLTALYVFEHTAPGTIKFVLIGLTPYSFRYVNTEDFAFCPKSLQYILTLKNCEDDSLHGQLLQLLISDGFESQIMAATEKDADTNFEQLKSAVNRKVSANSFVTWRDELNNLTKDYNPEVVAQNLSVLESYIELCLQNGATPICFTFPFAPVMSENYDKKILVSFRNAISKLIEKHGIYLIDLFGMYLDYSYFCNMTHLNWQGSMLASSILNIQIHNQNILPFEDFCKMSYKNILLFSQILDEDVYSELMKKVYTASVEKIRRKSKIKVGFVLYDSSMWCGDKLYELFAQNERYEVTIFLCLRTDKKDDEKVRDDFFHGVNQFTERGLNISGIATLDTEIPTQDVLIFITPYLNVLPAAFQLENFTAETLTAYIPYGFTVTADWIRHMIGFMKIMNKRFLDTKFEFEKEKRNQPNSTNELYYSGYPRMDVFFEDKVKFQYDWKMTTPNAKKIIWAPHWSINDGIKYSTFHHNYKFMYEYAKAHPEISWVVKPHPNLLFSAVTSGVFKSTEDFQKYLQEWDDLPNAKVETGGYYQAIFATSDGMIQDSGSFIVEYQFTHKPMIFLTRKDQDMSAFTRAILERNYMVAGDDLEGIAELMEKVFVNGEDELFEVRKKFFDENLNYQKENGMLASEFIFKTISAEFED